MFPKKLRLPLTKEKGKWTKIFTSPYFLLKARDANAGYNRFAVIIAAGSIKKSTDRHFWKRQFAAELRLWPNFKKDFLIIVLPKIGATNKKNIRNELNKILQQLMASRATSQ
ncbi:MAG: ribonuclease P protein component [bacterium]|nr:ribonuclease P protein component [bacterium]